MALDWLVGQVCSGISTRLKASLMESVDEIEVMAKQICDRYWMVFRAKNRSQNNLPEDQRMLGRYGPFVRRHPSNQKLYIGWRDYAPSRKGVRGRVLGETMRPSEGIHYRDNQFSAKAKLWELKLIIDAERELRQLRELNEGIHKQLVSINKAERIYSWQQAKNVDVKAAIETNQNELLLEASALMETNPLDLM